MIKIESFLNQWFIYKEFMENELSKIKFHEICGDKAVK